MHTTSLLLLWLNLLLLPPPQPHKIEKSYTQKMTKDYKVPPLAKVEVLLKEKPSAVIKVTKEHGGKAATATATASKDR